MKEFKKTSETNDGCFHTIKYSNGIFTIVVDLDNPNYEINCETNFFNIHFQKIGSETSHSLSENFNMKFLSFDDLDKLIEDTQSIKEIVKYIKDKIIPTIKTGD